MSSSRLPARSGFRAGWVSFLLLLVFLCLPAALAKPLVERRFDPPLLGQVAEHTTVIIPGCDTWQQPGAPQLPFATLRLVIPAGAQVTGVRCTPLADILSLPLDGPVDFGRQPVPSSGGGLSAIPDGPDPDIYQSPLPFPQVRARMVSLQRLAGYDIAILHFFPVQYLPAESRLLFLPHCEIAVDYSTSKKVSSTGVVPPGEAARQRVAAFVHNPDDLAAYAPSASTRVPQTKAAADYLLITRSNLLAAFQPLVDLKTTQGLTVLADTVERITNSFSGRDAAEKIRNAIRHAYTNSGITYVLLGGDIATVPCRLAYVSMNQSELASQIPSDLYFACLDGSWNGDNDARWGEPTDGDNGADVDLLAEVFVGRAPVDTAGETALFVQKNLQYHAQPHPNAAQALFVAEFLQDYPSGPAQGGDMLDPLLSLFTSPYTITWLDDRPYTSEQWTKSQALAALNRSPYAAVYNGHGDTDRLMRFMTADLAALTNDYPFLFYSVGCNAGQFDNDKWSPDAIGEELLKRDAHGAFAAIFNSRLGWYDPLDEAKYSGEFQAHFFAAVFNGGLTNLAIANQLGKQALIGHVETSGSLQPYRWCYYEINLLGDPALPWQFPAITPSEVELTILSPRGQLEPAAGVHRFSSGSVITCAVPDSPLAGDPGYQYLPDGWSGSGSLPPSGSSNTITFTITNDTQLHWHWQTQVWLSLSAADHGQVTTLSRWIDLGASSSSIVAVSDTYYHFQGWQGDLPPDLSSNATLEITLDQPRQLVASFAPNLTSQGTPEWWLAQFGWTNLFESTALADSDLDGQPAWQEYLAGTSPVDSADCLRLQTLGFSTNGICELSWPSVAGRTYAILAATDLASSGFVVVTNNLPATPPVNRFFDPGPVGEHRFYRLSVQWEP